MQARNCIVPRYYYLVLLLMLLATLTDGYTAPDEDTEKELGELGAAMRFSSNGNGTHSSPASVGEKEKNSPVHEKQSAKHGIVKKNKQLKPSKNLPKSSAEVPCDHERASPESKSGSFGSSTVLIGILSAPNHREHRDAQRRAWLQHHFCKSGKTRVRFFVGMSGDSEVDKLVAEEAKQSGDIAILSDLQDTYYNIAAKTKAMVHMAVEMGADFLLKCDDDTYVNIDGLIKTIPKNQGKRGGLVLAAVNYYQSPQRTGKWAMPVKDFPGSRYPPFPSGPGYVIGKDILKYADGKLKSGELKPLALEDVSMGIWIDSAKKAGVTVHFESKDGSEDGSGEGDINIAGCHPGAIVSHYINPTQMVCMWGKQTKGQADFCC